MDFWQELAISFFGTLAGAATALLSGAYAQRREAQSKEAAALNGLLLDLNLKRALSIGNPSYSDPSVAAKDIGRCSESVLDTRRLIREARTQLRPNSGAFGQLADMAGACNLYLHKANIKPGKYQFYLAELQSQLDKLATDLSESKRIVYRRPGGAAYISTADPRA